MFETNPINDADADIILGLLRASERGHVVTYAEMSKAIARDVRGVARAALARARKRAAKEDAIYFAADPGVGMRRLSEAEKVAKHDDVIGRARRAARRDDERLSSVDIGLLADGEKSKLVAARLENSIVRKLASKRSRDKLLAGVEGAAGGPLPTAKAVRFLLGEQEQL
jgi:hypothetical protein